MRACVLYCVLHVVFFIGWWLNSSIQVCVVCVFACCLIVFLLACLPACLPACLLACLLACLCSCLRAYFLLGTHIRTYVSAAGTALSPPGSYAERTSRSLCQLVLLQLGVLVMLSGPVPEPHRSKAKIC